MGDRQGLRGLSTWDGAWCGAGWVIKTTFLFFSLGSSWDSQAEKAKALFGQPGSGPVRSAPIPPTSYHSPPPTAAQSHLPGAFALAVPSARKAPPPPTLPSPRLHGELTVLKGHPSEAEPDLNLYPDVYHCSPPRHPLAPPSTQRLFPLMPPNQEIIVLIFYVYYLPPTISC